MCVYFAQNTERKQKTVFNLPGDTVLDVDATTLDLSFIWEGLWSVVNSSSFNKNISKYLFLSSVKLSLDFITIVPEGKI